MLFFWTRVLTGILNNSDCASSGFGTVPSDKQQAVVFTKQTYATSLGKRACTLVGALAGDQVPEAPFLRAQKEAVAFLFR
jgi:hypothetical protein